MQQKLEQKRQLHFARILCRTGLPTIVLIISGFYSTISYSMHFITLIGPYGVKEPDEFIHMIIKTTIKNRVLPTSFLVCLVL